MAEPSKAVATYDSEILSRSGQAGIEMRALMEQVPEADEDAYGGILMAILNAESPADLDAAWTARSLEQYCDTPLRVESIKRMPSDFADGLGAYLVVNAVIPGDGERVTMTTGSVSVVAQLVKANALGAFPLIVVPRKANRPSANGYYPMHLEIVAAR